MPRERACAGRKAERCAHAQAVPRVRRSGLRLCARASVSFPSPKAPGSVTHNSKDVGPSRAARKLSRRPGWSQPAALWLQVAGQRRGRLSGQGPRLCHAAPGEPGVGSTRGPFCHSPTPWRASRVSRGSACARVFKPPAGESARGKESDGPASPRKGCREWEEAGATREDTC